MQASKTVAMQPPWTVEFALLGWGVVSGCVGRGGGGKGVLKKRIGAE